MARFKLDGAQVLITGGARGLGLAPARAMQAQGARLVLTDIDPDTLHRAADTLAPGGPVRAERLDVRDPEAFRALVARVEAAAGPIDVLVNNAGIMPVGPALEEDLATTRLQLDINVLGVMHGVRAVLPGLLARRRGAIVNIASVAGVVGIPGVAGYCATKHAVIGYTEALRREHLDSGVHIGLVCPSLANTELASGTGRMRWPPLVQPEEVAAAVIEVATGRAVTRFVPRSAAIAQILPAVLPRRVAERLGILFGMRDVFARVDAKARAAYQARTDKLRNPPSGGTP